MVPINNTTKQAWVHHILGETLEVFSQKQDKDTFVTNASQLFLDISESLINPQKTTKFTKNKEKLNITFHKLYKHI